VVVGLPAEAPRAEAGRWSLVGGRSPLVVGRWSLVGVRAEDLAIDAAGRFRGRSRSDCHLTTRLRRDGRRGDAAGSGRGPRVPGSVRHGARSRAVGRCRPPIGRRRGLRWARVATRAAPTRIRPGFEGSVADRFRLHWRRGCEFVRARIAFEGRSHSRAAVNALLVPLAIVLTLAPSGCDAALGTRRRPGMVRRPPGGRLLSSGRSGCSASSAGGRTDGPRGRRRASSFPGAAVITEGARRRARHPAPAREKESPCTSGCRQDRAGRW